MRINTYRICFLALLLSTNALGLEIQGINFVSVPLTRATYSSFRTKASLEHLKSTGANWISIPVVWFQDEVDSSEMHPIIEEVTTKSSANRSPNEKEIKAVLLEAKNLDLNSLNLQVEFPPC